MSRKVKKEQVSGPDRIVGRVTSSASKANLRLNRKYYDQELEKEREAMKNTPIMQYVREVVKEVVKSKLYSKTEGTPEWEDIDKLENEKTIVPDDEPDQKEAHKKARDIPSLFPKARNFKINESSTFGSDSFQGSNFGFGGKNQIVDKDEGSPYEKMVQAMPKNWTEDEEEMQLPSSRDRREKLGYELGGSAKKSVSNGPMDECGCDGSGNPNRDIEEPADLSDEELAEALGLTETVAVVNADGLSLHIDTGKGVGAQIKKKVDSEESDEEAEEANEEDLELDEAVLREEEKAEEAKPKSRRVSINRLPKNARFKFKGNVYTVVDKVMDDPALRKVGSIGSYSPEEAKSKLIVTDKKGNRKTLLVKRRSRVKTTVAPANESKLAEALGLAQQKGKNPSVAKWFNNDGKNLVVAGAEDFSSNMMGSTGGSRKTVQSPNLEEQRSEADALYRDLPGMAIDPAYNDKNIDPDPVPAEEIGADSHMGGMGVLVKPREFVPEKSNALKAAAQKKIAERLEALAKRKKLGV